MENSVKNKIKIFLSTYGIGMLAAFALICFIGDIFNPEYSFGDFISDVFFGSFFAYSVGLLLEARRIYCSVKNWKSYN